MSRTDKDVPTWASAEYYEPSHRYRCINNTKWRAACDDVPCSLPDKVVRHAPAWGHRHRECTWEPVWPERRRYRYTWGPKRKDRHFNWWGPDRAKVRDQMVKAKQEYNGSHEVETVERVDQHRHGPVSGWWD